MTLSFVQESFFLGHIQLCVLGVGLDKAAARLHLIAHQDGECFVGLFGILNGDLYDDAVIGVHGGLPELLRVHLAKALIAVHLGTRHLLRKHGHFGVVVGIFDGVALLHLEQGRLGHIHMALLDERAHVTEEEGEHQGTDVGAIHIGIGHDEHFIVAAAWRYRTRHLERNFCFARRMA